MPRTLVYACLALAATAAHAEGLIISPLDLGTGPNTAQPSVAVDPGRGFIATWQQRDGARTRLDFVEINRDGSLGRRGTIADSARSGSNGATTRWFVNWADFPSLVVLDNGDWVAHWLQKNGDSTYAYEIRLTRSTDRGRSWSSSTVPHTDGTPTEHGFVSMVAAGDDRVRLVWLDGRETAAAAPGQAPGHDSHGRMTLRSAVLDRSQRLHEETQLDASTCSCCQTDLVRAGPRTLTAYRDHGTADLRNIHWLTLERGRWSAEHVLHDDGWRIAGCPVNGPALAAGDAGVLAVWATMHGEQMVVRAAQGDGTRFSSPVDLESSATTLGRVDAAAWGRDGFLATWLGAGTAADATALRLVELDAGLGLRSSHSLVELPPGRATGVPRIAAADGMALVTWVEGVDGKPTVRAALIRPSSNKQ
ncbi:MAG: exo-alpha-sialidase [Rhodanobacteraceae bacterium]|nr:exo-alpha-sialidase [Rhodanobacteraceae bacterium]